MEAIHSHLPLCFSLGVVNIFTFPPPPKDYKSWQLVFCVPFSFWATSGLFGFLQVLLRCLVLLKRFAHEYRLGAQSELDSLNTQYLEMKCSAMFLKIR